MYRKIMKFLETWKENKHRKPLILRERFKFCVKVKN